MNVENNGQAEEKLTIKELIDYVKKNKHSDFEFIRSLSELYWAIKFRTSVRKVYNSFVNSANKTYNRYCKDLGNLCVGYDLLLLYLEYIKCCNFFDEEYKIIDGMIQEYYSYLKSGHVIDSIILGNYRPEEDLVDYRKS